MEPLQTDTLYLAALGAVLLMLTGLLVVLLKNPLYLILMLPLFFSARELVARDYNAVGVTLLHVGFLAASQAQVDAAYSAAIAAGATDNGAPGARLYYDPRYYAANVFDPDGYSLEFVFKSWQHPQQQ